VSDEAVFYAIPGSHAAHTGHLMLEQKGIPFRRVNLMPGFHRVYVRLRGFPGDRVPAVRFADGGRAQGTRPLARPGPPQRARRRRPPRSAADAARRADFQIATSLALIEYRVDVRDELRRRPGAQLMERVLPGPG
jgi:hypothetical protein